MIDTTKIQFTKGVQFMPVLADKKPIHKDWQNTVKDYDFSKAEAVGIVCGKPSGNLEAIDADIKYDLTGTLMNRFKELVNQLDPNLLKKLVVQKTMSGGYHLLYRCSFIEGNQKLANRETTQEERQKTFEEEYASELKKQTDAGKSLAEAKQFAQAEATKHANNDKIRVLFETRGDKGYIACYPTAGYKVVQGSFDSIQTITPEERSTLINACYSFNEVLKQPVHREIKQKKQQKGLTSIEDYNDRGDVITLLESHGWTAVGRKGSKILLKRPGDTKAAHSGNYDEEKKWFSVFSTSTEFESQAPYLPYAVFCVLECGGQWNEVPKKLADLGFGDNDERIKENNEKVPSMIDVSDDDLSFFATEEDYDDYLHKWRTKTFEMGKTTGIPELDEHFLFKEGNLVIVNGIDNVGKSTVVWYLSMVSALYHGWSWIIFSSENRVGAVVRKLIEFYWCEPIDEMTPERYSIAKNFVKEHFSIIKCNDKMFNYQDILNMTTKAMRVKQYKGLMIDPYNSLKVDIPKVSKQQIYDYHYEAASVLQLFAKHNNISIYLNCHVGTVGARNKDKQGFTKAPNKEDTEGGVMFSNKADEFLTIHRVTNHQDNWRYTEIHVRKVKETETGGRVTYWHKPIDLMMINTQSGFISVPVRGQYGAGTNSILAYHNGPSKPKEAPISVVDFSAPGYSAETLFDTKEVKELPF